jgi:hypothetical protein
MVQLNRCYRPSHSLFEAQAQIDRPFRQPTENTGSIDRAAGVDRRMAPQKNPIIPDNGL